MLLRGVPLEQVAAVHAAVAEGFALDEVLAVEELPKQAWYEAELSWKRRLVEQQDVFSTYEQALEDHQQRLARRVVPIDDEVEAWVAFLRLYGDHDEPFAWLSELGLALPDLARLSRQWTRRFEAQPRLAKKADKLAKKLEARAAAGEAIVLGPITVGGRALHPSAAAGSFEGDSRRLAKAVEGRGAEVAAPVMGLDRYAALTAELGAVPAAGRAGVLARFGLDGDAAHDVDDAWRARLDSDDELRADFRALVRHYEATVSRRGAATRPPSTPVPAMPRSASVPPLPLPPVSSSVRSTTGAMPVMAHCEPLPFHGSVSEVARLVYSRPPAPPSGSVDATGDVIPALRDEDVLPFASVTLDGTGELSTSLIGLDTLPFDGPFDALPPSVVAFDAPHDALGLTTKLTALELDESALPFDDDLGESEDLDGTLALDREGGAGPASLPFAVGSLDDETLPVDGHGDAPPPSSETPTLEAGLDRTAFLSPLELGLDDDASVVGPASVPPVSPLPTLTLDQFASLQAELAVHADRASAIRQRYHLSDEASQRRLEEHWQARFAASPVERRAFTAKVAEFRQWLERRRG